MTTFSEMSGDGTLSVLASIPAWLTAPAEEGHVAQALTGGVAELAAGSLAVESCDAKLRLKADRPGWSVAYDLDLVDPEGRSQSVRLVGTFVPPLPGRTAASTAQGSFPSPDWHGRFPEVGLELGMAAADDALPALGALTDPDAARTLLEDAIRAGSSLDIAIRAVEVDVRRYKPGSRCTVLYRLHLEPGHGGPEAVVAKTYRGDKGENAFVGMQALWSAGITERSGVALAQPLAYLPEQRVLVQACVPEDHTLKEMVRDAMADGSADAVSAVRHEVTRTAAGLAALHRSGVVHGKTVDWDEERAELAELLDRLRPLLPDIAAAAGSILEALDPLARQEPPDAAVPSHRSFRPAQVLLHGEAMAFIDFDGLCMAEPALDVALFRAALRDAGTRGFAETGSSGVGDLEATLDVLDGLADDFLAAYGKDSPVSRTRVALWETLDLLTSVLHCWTKVKAERLPVRIALLRRHLRTAGPPAS